MVRLVQQDGAPHPGRLPLPTESLRCPRCSRRLPTWLHPRPVTSESDLKNSSGKEHRPVESKPKDKSSVAWTGHPGWHLCLSGWGSPAGGLRCPFTAQSLSRCVAVLPRDKAETADTEGPQGPSPVPGAALQSKRPKKPQQWTKLTR